MSEINKELAGSGARRLGLVTALAAAAVVMSQAAVAGETSAGMRIVKDPVSGQLRAPTADEAAALERAGRAQRRAPRGLITGRMNPAAIRHADGTVEQELDESSLAYTVMTRNADGTTSMVCVTGAEAADAAMNGKQSASKAAKASKEHTHDHK